jgi:hypothetical protein
VVKVPFKQITAPAGIEVLMGIVNLGAVGFPLVLPVFVPVGSI